MANSRTEALLWKELEARIPGVSKNPTADLQGCISKCADVIDATILREVIEPAADLLCKEFPHVNCEASDG